MCRNPVNTTFGMTSWAAALGLILSFVLPTANVEAQPLSVTKWSKSDPVAADRFGNAVDLDGTVAIVGAARDNDPVIKTGQYGAAYIFRFDGSTWLEEAKLTAPEREYNAWFGQAVAVDGTLALVGIRNDEANADGAVYVFRYDGGGWTEEAKLKASDGAAGDEFGAALAIEGNVALVGAPNHGATGSREGAVYAFRNDGSGWVEEAVLLPSDAVGTAYFGGSVSLSGTRALVGAWGDSPPAVGQSAGAAYVFEFEGANWVETAKLTAADASSLAQFGVTVSLDGDRALVGAPLDDEHGGGAGAAYVFRYSGHNGGAGDGEGEHEGDDEGGNVDGGWMQEAKLAASDYTGFNLFGSSVALDGMQAVVGARNWFPPGGNASGKAYFFQYDETLEMWQEQSDLAPGDGGGGDEFGRSVAVDDGVILVGSPEHDLPIGGVGAVYSYGEPVASSAEDYAMSSTAVLSDAFPNPFQQQAKVTLTLSPPEPVQVNLFDMLGRLIRVLHEGMWPAHTPQTISVSAEDLPNGVYLVRVETTTQIESRLVTLLR